MVAAGVEPAIMLLLTISGYKILFTTVIVSIFMIISCAFKSRGNNTIIY